MSANKTNVATKRCILILEDDRCIANSQPAELNHTEIATVSLQAHLADDKPFLANQYDKNDTGIMPHRGRALLANDELLGKISEPANQFCAQKLAGNDADFVPDVNRK
jgi:hypothetical protein